MATYIWPAQQVTIPGAATEATLLQVEANTADTVTELQTLNATDFATETTLNVVANNTANTVTEAQNIVTELQSVNTALGTLATEATVGTLATEATVGTLGTEATLATRASEATLALVATEATLQQISSDLATQSPISVQMQLDAILLDTSSTAIPASSGNPLEVVASSSIDVRKIVSVEDIGEYIGLYTGPALSETLVAVLPLGGGELEVNIPSGERISLRALKNSAINVGDIAINFLAIT